MPNNSKAYVTIMDYPEYETSCIGYIRIRTFRYLQDLEIALKEFKRYRFHVPDHMSKDLDKWIYYQTHIFLLDYFKSNINIFNNLYIEFIDNYKYFYIAEKNHFKKYYSEQISIISNSVLTSLKILAAEGGYPHRVICYCFKNLLEDYPPAKIANELLSKNLDILLDLFIDNYSYETEIPLLYVAYLFETVRDDLDSELNDLVYKYGNYNEDFTKIVEKILSTRTGSTLLENYFSIDQKNKPQIIVMWCKRVKERIINKTLAFLKDKNNYFEV
ncbi:hypothetical protein [Pseudobacteroides cellulosolvens]|uniref:Uncharacterized protein n=1 Tax=Pseudobacteroides cellulosolvens ATCC 35603 = DSM 2933 TaxID=398512 RepID=A0A0L6JIP6_9FIRM|nr:hypothetical protein [Pseudobacteroides cellulosolvens]KNY25573.1 hypothetical protein Bccel_0833 [Pseudobacteroides cellulosolvens ATCC 35603 = DSM 2933]